MKTYLSAAAIAAMLSTNVAAPAYADGKDVLFGAIVGAIVNEAARNKNQRRSTSTRAPSLNSQFSRAERIEIQSSLQRLGYNIGAIDGALGPTSRRVIGQWQASRGEAQTGQLTRAQFVALVSGTPGSTMAFASRPLDRSEIVMLQESLQRLGYYRGGIDGQSGPGTRGGTNAFVTAQGYVVGQLTPVQVLVLARQSSGLVTPPYLMTEASSQLAAQQQQNGFGAPQQQQGGFGTQQATFGQQQGQQGFGVQQGQQQGFGTQQATFGAAPQQGQALFGAAPQQGQQGTFGTGQVQPQANGTFAVPQGQLASQPGGAGVAPQSLFAPVPQQGQQQLFAPQQGGVIQQQQGTTGQLLAPQGQQQAPASTLDIFSGGTTQQQVAPTAPLAPAGSAPQILVGGEGGTTATQPSGQLLFAPASN
ncbi:MAG: peptidoglycan-binding protein [Rhodobacteraceae bacterium]|nr:peptidoglycan-binding protein [Paracoccaceae bacterium]